VASNDNSNLMTRDSPISDDFILLPKLRCSVSPFFEEKKESEHHAEGEGERHPRVASNDSNRM
jgi:hypothetical protein